MKKYENENVGSTIGNKIDVINFLNSTYGLTMVLCLSVLLTQR
jgi:hypothetical protein